MTEICYLNPMNAIFCSMSSLLIAAWNSSKEMKPSSFVSASATTRSTMCSSWSWLAKKNKKVYFSFACLDSIPSFLLSNAKGSNALRKSFHYMAPGIKPVISQLLVICRNHSTMAICLIKYLFCSNNNQVEWQAFLYFWQTMFF